MLEEEQSISAGPTTVNERQPYISVQSRLAPQPAPRLMTGVERWRVWCNWRRLEMCLGAVLPKALYTNSKTLYLMLKDTESRSSRWRIGVMCSYREDRVNIRAEEFLTTWSFWRVLSGHAV